MNSIQVCAIRTYIHTYIHTYIRTYIHTYIHTYFWYDHTPLLSAMYSGVSSPVRILTPEPLDNSTSPEKSPDFYRRPRDTRMLSPEKSPIVIRKYTRSPDVMRRYDSLRSPDLRMRSLDGISSLPQLKEGSLESSLEDLEITPKPSPEREIVDTPAGGGGGGGGRRSGRSSSRDSPQREITIKLSTPPRTSPSRHLPKESSPETKGRLVAGTGGSRVGQGGLEKESFPPSLLSDDVESSFEIVSKLSEDTVSVHSEDFVEELHSKTASDDISTSSLTVSTAAATRGGVAIEGGVHLKAASDDITVASKVSKLRIRSKTESQSMTGMDKVGVTSPRHLQLAPGSGGGGGGGEGGSRDDINRDHPISEALPPETITAPDDKVVEVGETGGGSEDPVPDHSTIISPTLKMADRTERMKGSGQNEQSLDEDDLFEMLGGTNEPLCYPSPPVQQDDQHKQHAGDDADSPLLTHDQEDTAHHSNGSRDGDLHEPSTEDDKRSIVPLEPNEKADPTSEVSLETEEAEPTTLPSHQEMGGASPDHTHQDSPLVVEEHIADVQEDDITHSHDQEERSCDQNDEMLEPLNIDEGTDLISHQKELQVDESHQDGGDPHESRQDGGDPHVVDESHQDGGDPQVDDPRQDGGDPQVDDPRQDGGDPQIDDPRQDGGDPQVDKPHQDGGDPQVDEPHQDADVSTSHSMDRIKKQVSEGDESLDDLCSQSGEELVESADDQLEPQLRGEEEEEEEDHERYMPSLCLM